MGETGGNETRRYWEPRGAGHQGHCEGLGHPNLDCGLISLLLWMSIHRGSRPDLPDASWSITHSPYYPIPHHLNIGSYFPEAQLWSSPPPPPIFSTMSLWVRFNAPSESFRDLSTIRHSTSGGWERERQREEKGPGRQAAGQGKSEQVPEAWPGEQNAMLQQEPTETLEWMRGGSWVWGGAMGSWASYWKKGWKV